MLKQNTNVQLCNNTDIYKSKLDPYSTTESSQIKLRQHHSHDVQDFDHHGTFKCDDCSFVTIRKANLRYHVTTKHMFESCPSCNRVFSCKSINRHKEICGKMSLYKCPHCVFTSKHPSYIKRHIQISHIQTNKVKFACPKCGNKYARLQYMRNHLENKCQKKEDRYSCNYCSYKTNDKGYLHDHMRHRHLRNRKNSNVKALETS